ncbi:hypothetical protein [Halodesulfovibrio marinisediminis]|uniref:Uncharacterized protein n=1 Tax=Halodesulfovibrio marinisediminis DSM 17456 TaxID=1121457 RepID=A0A1N6DQF2_9BACT|nr:hypothetical protein [Halodesulfovibrio marinisediminis]SIN72947.1 hypothetical protein SAMN02745161_0387 [Halodesulfovibrio marinisediminis DSM 17456]
MPTFVSPDGNFEAWEAKPTGYFEVEEWERDHSTPQPTQDELTQQRIKEIQSLLTANDLASVRPLRAKLAGTATEADDARLAELEEQAQKLRAELVTLNALV